MLLDKDTIVALSTPSGRGALAVVRLSGADAHEVAKRVLDPWPAQTRRATLAVVRDPDTGEQIDQVIALLYAAPRSYTGEPMVELSGHGGAAAPAAVIRALLRAGARQARPGEFTQRAVLNGRMDLLQAEGIADLIAATTDAMRRVAVHQTDGGLSRSISTLRGQVLTLEALLAYDIDFPEEDDGPVPRDRILTALDEVCGGLRELLSTSELGTIVQSGARVVIAGAPNAGKSSLFNALLGEHRALVTDIPGTTRDALEATLDVAGMPLRIIDTAGLRENGTSDLVERLGIELAERHITAAHVVLACGESEASLARTLQEVRRLTAAPIIAVHTKTDLAPSGPSADISVSAYTRAGLATLVERVGEILRARYGSVDQETPIVSRTRHRLAIEGALGELEAFAAEVRGGAIPLSVAAVRVRVAADMLGELIGSIQIDDVLGAVFAEFCVGK